LTNTTFLQKSTEKVLTPLRRFCYKRRSTPNSIHTKKKSGSKSALGRRSPWVAVLSGRSFPGHAPASVTEIAKAEVFTRRRLGEAGFFNLRALLGLTLCLLGLALAIPALRPAADQPPRHMPVPGAKPRENLVQLEQYWHNRLTYPTCLAQSPKSAGIEHDQFYRARSATGADDGLFAL
jgi:hypothetical protein